MRIEDLPPKHQAEIARQLGNGKPLGLARANEVRAVEVMPLPSGVISFVVSGDPKGQPRPRAFAMKMGNGKFSARVFDAGTAEAWKQQVAVAATPNRPAAPFVGPVALRIEFLFRRPKAHFRANGAVKAGSPNLHTGKPDADNLAKAVMDALTQLGGFWQDDAQVAQLVVGKSYGERPGAVVEIKEAL